MVDSVNLVYPVRVTDAANDLVKTVKFMPSNGFEPPLVAKISLYEHSSGYFVYCKGEYAHTHQASLPILLGHKNSCLIKNQEEMDQAVKLLVKKAQSVGVAESSDSHYSRVDLVWQLRIDPALMALVYRNAMHPRLHREATLYVEKSSRSLEWRGAEMVIRMYDKLQEMCGRKGDITRVEIELRGRRLQEELGAGGYVTKLDFWQCYCALRRILLGFPASRIFQQGKFSKAGYILTLAEQNGLRTADGLKLSDLYFTLLSSEKQKRRLRNELSARLVALKGVDFAELLPEKQLPPIVEL